MAGLYGDPRSINPAMGMAISSDQLGCQGATAAAATFRQTSPRGITHHAFRVFTSVFPPEEPLLREEGQDLVEYALVVALIALAATAGMNTLATDIANAFSNIGSTLNADI